MMIVIIIIIIWFFIFSVLAKQSQGQLSREQENIRKIQK